MENKRPTFDETVSVLVKAYLNDTLEHGDCEACAVGNIVHAAGFPRYNYGHMPSDSCGMWRNLFFTIGGTQCIRTGSDDDMLIAKRMIKTTGYTVQQLALVEYFFETAEGNSNDERMFNGLMAVVDVLADIHGISLEQKESAKSLFVKS